MDKLTRSRFIELAEAQEKLEDAIEAVRECISTLGTIESDLVHDINMVYLNWFVNDDSKPEDLPSYILELKSEQPIVVGDFMFTPLLTPSDEHLINISATYAPVVIPEVEQ